VKPGLPSTGREIAAHRHTRQRPRRQTQTTLSQDRLPSPTAAIGLAIAKADVSPCDFSAKESDRGDEADPRR
jgi:hypothetical protein